MPDSQTKLTVISSTADILEKPAELNIISKNDSQLLYGEEFIVEESHGAYVYGHGILDGYKGYVERGQLVKDSSPANVIVKSHHTHIYPEPSYKSRPHTALSFLSRLTTLEETNGNFTKLEDGDWIFTDHITPIKNFKMSGDMAQTASMYLNTAYLYGGRSCFGIDCSGLMQKVVMAHGFDVPPRDSEQQVGAFGKAIKKEDVQRNDIAYFKNHAGIMIDDKNILNATARHMTTLVESLDDLEKIYDGIVHIARL